MTVTTRHVIKTIFLAFQVTSRSRDLRQFTNPYLRDRRPLPLLTPLHPLRLLLPRHRRHRLHPLPLPPSPLRRCAVHHHRRRHFPLFAPFSLPLLCPENIPQFIWSQLLKLSFIVYMMQRTFCDASCRSRSNNNWPPAKQFQSDCGAV